MPALFSGIWLTLSTASSADQLAPPVFVRRAPTPVEFAQPSPAAPRFAHGHAAVVPSPEQKADPLVVSQSSGMPFWFTSSAVPSAISHTSPARSPSQSA